MNKRIFTMLTAGLLLGGPTFNAVYAQSAKTIVEYTNNNTALANGTQFFLGTDNGSVNVYKVSDVLTTKDKKEVVTLDFDGVNINSDDAAVFEIRNYSNRSFELWTKVDGKSYQVITTTDGKAVTDVSSKNLSDFNTAFVVKDGKLKFSGLFTVALPSSEIGSDVKAFSYSTAYTAADLNEYNSKGTTLSFEYNTPELVGNLFENLTPVTVATTTENALQAGTYFVKGDKEDVEAFANTPSDATAKEISFLAVDPAVRYNIDGKQENEGYALYWMKGEKAIANTDSCKNAIFTITAKDVLNEDGVLTLKVNYTKKDAARATEVYVAGVKPSASDTKTYVTTVLASGSKYTPIHPQLGANSYLDASVLLKKNAENVVNVYFTSSTKSQNDQSTNQTEYHKYLIIDPEDGSSLKAVAYNDADFTMPLAQWIVAGFDGKYTFTLTNRETRKDLVLKLQPEGAENGYQVVSANYDGNAASINADKGVTNTLNLNKTSVKFNSIATTRTDGSVVFTDIQVEEGVKLTFNGEDPLFGNQALYAIVDVDNDAMKAAVSLDNGEKEIVLYPERVKGADNHFVKALQGAADYVLSENTYAYLNDKNEVATSVDTLVVPTYILRTTEVTGDNAKYLNTNYKTNAAKANAAEFAFVKNAAGGYSLVTLTTSSVSVGLAEYADAIAADYAYVFTNNMTIATASQHYAEAAQLNQSYANVVIAEANPFNPSLAAKPRHASFDNILGSVSYQLNENTIAEGILSAESMIFWLDTANSADKIPAFYISKGIATTEDTVETKAAEQPAERMFLFNATDSSTYFVEGSAQEYTDRRYYLEGTMNSKAIFRPAILTGVDTIATTVEGKAVEVTNVVDKDGNVHTDALDNFKFYITLADEAVDDEYVIQSKRDEYYVYALNGILGLTSNKDLAMVFTLGDEVPTANESVADAVEGVKVVGGNGYVEIHGAAGKNVVVTNILGKVIANTVLTSDNQTINVPAGIVVVAVEGEETAKAVVK